MKIRYAYDSFTSRVVYYRRGKNLGFEYLNYTVLSFEISQIKQKIRLLNLSWHTEINSMFELHRVCCNSTK